MRTAMRTAAVVLLAATTAACSEPESETTAPSSTPTSLDCPGDALVECAKRSSIGAMVPDPPREATGEPIKLGLVNQENTAAGSYPELSAAVQAAVDFVNERLGGVNGRPIEVEVCNTEFSTEGSTACGQHFVETGAVAVLGGIDVFGNAIETLAQNGIPFVGGIPVSTQSVTSENSFQWSGGSWAAAVAFAEHASTTLGAKKVSIVYGDFGSIAHAAEYGKKVLTDRGVSTQLVPFPIMATDLSAALNAAVADGPDAVIVMAADSGCRSGFDGLAALGTTAQKYFTGACAAPAITSQVGNAKTEGTIFNVEGPIDRDDPTPDGALYNGVIAEYGSAGLDPVGAGTVTFRSFMNLYAVLGQIEGEITPASIMAALRAQEDTPSFSGHDSTCDRQQFEGLPAMCSPQQILAEMRDGLLYQVGDWVDVGALYRA